MVAPRSESGCGGGAANDGAIPKRRRVVSATDARANMWSRALMQRQYRGFYQLESPAAFGRFRVPMDRQHRRDLKHDRFVDEIGSLSDRARDNQRFLYLITGAVVALALIGYGIYFYRSSREQRAQEALE